MKTVKRVAAMILLLACVIAVAGGQSAQRASVKVQWEYKVIVEEKHDSQDQIEKLLNELGSQGWELVQKQPRGGDEGGSFYFKRQK
jgi:hypothetical protein